MSQARIPIEICEHILDHLWDNTQALLSCSLTCRAWVTTTRVHIFRTIKLSGDRRCVQLDQLLTSSATASTTIADCIRELTIEGVIPGFDDVPDEDQTDQPGQSRPHSALQWIPKLLPRMRLVEELRLSCLHWDEVLEDQEIVNTLRTFSSNVKALHLLSVTFHDSREIIDLILFYPRVSKLGLSLIAWWNDAPDTGAPRPGNDELDVLNIQELHRAPHATLRRFPVIVTLISKIHSLRMRSIVIDLGFFTVDEISLDFFDWTQLDRVLTSLSERLPALVVSFSFKFLMQQDEVLPDVAQQLSSYIRGALDTGLRAKHICGGAVSGRSGYRVPDKVVWLA
ncbi:hypothetical protein WOLCODRAFT_19183 [Wolfiporia cocos MD-104 SS10]|uniref:F-box domain-containing protein n=1 Tax=Wolfiporia cocos (strain MD-104) TaxID=742152 RepID=A0A2H3K3U0_WOLCO|nr:hypothetical protein WOLCODRAFT_19183 [Wolfiporia cocos MD-104 SS10]